MKTLNDGRKISDVGTLINELLSRLEFIAEENTLLELAAAYSVMGNEDPSDYSETIKKQKLAAFKEDRELADFFLTFAFGLTQKFSEHSNLNILDYFQRNRSDSLMTDHYSKLSESF
jgi:hypothetical protein